MDLETDVVVVGAGLFGQVISAELRARGAAVTMVDCGKANAGSGPSASLMKPSWMQGMASHLQDRAYELLDRHYGVHDLSFKVGPLKVDTVRWCDPRAIIAPEPDLPFRVVQVRGRRVWFNDNGTNRHIDATQAVVVAAGVWCNELLAEHQVPGLEGKTGVACFWHGQSIAQPFIRPWAPYKQLVAFNMDGLVLWVGDGTAIKQANWTPERQAQSVERCARAVDRAASDDLLEVRVGHRPYVPKREFPSAEGNVAAPCYLRALEPGLWVATGGAKNGTIAAGWAASVLGRALS